MLITVMFYTICCLVVFDKYDIYLKLHFNYFEKKFFEVTFRTYLLTYQYVIIEIKNAKVIDKT